MLSPYHCEFRVLLPRQGLRWRLCDATPERMPDGGTLWHGIISDITERKAAEEALRASEFRWNFAIDGSGDGLWDWDARADTVFYSRRWKEMIGFAENEIGNSLDEWEKRLHPDDKARVMAAAQAHRAGSEPLYLIEHRFGCRDGSWKWILARGVVVERDAAGKPLRVIGTHSDITARKQAEAALVASEQRYRSILNASPDNITLTDLQGRIIMVSPAALPMFGFEREEEVLGQRVTDFLIPSEQEKALEKMARMFEGIRSGVNEYCAQRRDGSHFDMEVNSEFVRDAAGKPTHFIFIARDVTARKRTEDALTRATDRLSLATRAGGVGIWDFDVRNNRLIWDDMMHRLYGTPLEQFGGAYEAWQKGIHPDDRARTDAEIQAALRGEKEFDTEFRVLWPDGSVRYIRALSLLKRDALGLPLNMIGTNWDITAQKQAEKSLQTSLHEKEALLKEVHHRVKNNLQVVTSLLRLEAARSGQSATKSVLEDMQGRIRSMAMLHESLYRSGTFAAVDLGAYIKQISTQLFRVLVATPGTIQLLLDMDSVPIEMDQAMPCGLLVNELVSNSLKHGFPPGHSGEIRVELHRLEGGPQLCLIVSDTGVGLPADLEVKRCQSLGLQLVGDLTRQLEGKLEIGRGPGAEFKITFKPRPTGAELTMQNH